MSVLAKTGDPDIDKTHERLAELIALIINKISLQQSVMQDLQDLYILARNHFIDEEELMTEIDYPFSVSHMHVHMDMLTKINVLQSLDVSRLKELELMTKTLERSIVEHVEHYDTALFEYNRHYWELHGS